MEYVYIMYIYIYNVYEIYIYYKLKIVLSVRYYDAYFAFSSTLFIYRFGILFYFEISCKSMESQSDNNMLFLTKRFM